jgi:hypothetical protein
MEAMKRPAAPVRLEVKQKSQLTVGMSANDPKRTSGRLSPDDDRDRD